MSSRQKRVCCLVSGSLLLICLATQSGWLGGNPARLLAPVHAGEHQNKAQSDSSERLRELLEERYEILKTFVEREKHLVKLGQRSIGGIAEATAAMLRAEADLCSTNSARIKIHEKIVTILREWEDSITRAAKAGRAHPDAKRKASLARLKAEIKLEKLKLARQK